ncbi:MAG: hypothetical protein FWC36_01725 [Spirochaetes bacterium]|nr:hypothetical protein [Spirochaetota bacterium]
MAKLISEPLDYNPQTEDWQKLLYKLTTTTGGLNLIEITQSDGENPPRVVKGSRLEVNGSFYQVDEDELITGFSALPLNALSYIYAEPQENGVLLFNMSPAVPVMSIAKGGLFNGASRCIALIRRIGAAEYNLIRLDNNNRPTLNVNDQDSFQTVFNRRQTFESDGVFVVPEGVTQIFVSAIAAGGTGGRGGNSNRNTVFNITFGNGGAAGANGSFIINQAYPATPGEQIAIQIGIPTGDRNTVISNLVTVIGGANGANGANYQRVNTYQNPSFNPASRTLGGSRLIEASDIINVSFWIPVRTTTTTFSGGAGRGNQGNGNAPAALPVGTGIFGIGGPGGGGAVTTNTGSSNNYFTGANGVIGAPGRVIITW